MTYKRRYLCGVIAWLEFKTSFARLGIATRTGGQSHQTAHRLAPSFIGAYGASMNIRQDEYLTLNLTETECKDIFLPYDDNYLIDYLMNCIDVSQRNDLLAECKNEALSYFSYSYNSTLDNYVDENGYYDINEFHVDFIKGYPTLNLK